MKKSLIFALAVISILIIFPSALAPSHAATYNKVGVRAGDWMEYSVRYYSVHPSFPESEYYPSSMYNKVHVEVLSVKDFGTDVTIKITYFYPNNTTSSSMWSGDISDRLCDYLVLSGLSAGDIVCNEKIFLTLPLRVSETINMTVLGTTKYVNIVDPTSFDMGNITIVIMDAQEILLFEKETGILVKSMRSSLLLGWMEESITGTSVFTPVYFVTATLILFAGVVAAITMTALFIIADRRHLAR